MATAAPKTDGQLCYPYGRTSTDEEILSEILNALHYNTGVPQDRVRVEVREGHAVLSGVVAQEFERALAEQVVTNAQGVREVTNQLRLES